LEVPFIPLYHSLAAGKTARRLSHGRR
jgi:hypothetical protein